MFSKNTQHSIIKEIYSQCGNYVIVICKIKTETFAFLSIYGPNNDQPEFFQELFEQLKGIEVDHTILGGDFNFIIDPQTDALNYARENNVNARKKLIQLIQENNIVDIWRQFNPLERKYTWTRRNPLKCGCLDMFFASDHLVNRITDVNIVPGYRTDHCAITLTIQTKQEPRGSGLWMFNISHLSNEEYVKRIQTCIQDTLKQYAVPLYTQETYTNYNQ